MTAVQDLLVEVEPALNAKTQDAMSAIVSTLTNAYNVTIVFYTIMSVLTTALRKLTTTTISKHVVTAQVIASTVTQLNAKPVQMDLISCSTQMTVLNAPLLMLSRTLNVHLVQSLDVPNVKLEYLLNVMFAQII